MVPAEFPNEAGPVQAGGPTAGCGNCGADLIGRYCHRCGAQQFDQQDLSLGRFVSEAAHEITDLERSKLLRTLIALLFRPGRLTLDYFSARRGRYIRPLPLVLAIFALNLFVFSASDRVQMFDIHRLAEAQASAAEARGLPPQVTIRHKIDEQARRQSVPPQIVEERISDRWQTNASFIQLPQVILLALVLQLAFLFSGRHFVEHLVFSMHFIAFQVLTVVAMWPIYYLLGVRVSSVLVAIVAAKFLIDTLYLFLAMRRFYPDRLGKTLLRAPFVFGGYFVIYIASHIVGMMAALRSVLGS